MANVTKQDLARLLKEATTYHKADKRDKLWKGNTAAHKERKKLNTQLIRAALARGEEPSRDEFTKIAMGISKRLGIVESSTFDDGGPVKETNITDVEEQKQTNIVRPSSPIQRLKKKTSFDPLSKRLSRRDNLRASTRKEKEQRKNREKEMSEHKQKRKEEQRELEKKNKDLKQMKALNRQAANDELLRQEQKQAEARKRVASVVYASEERREILMDSNFIQTPIESKLDEIRNEMNTNLRISPRAYGYGVGYYGFAPLPGMGNFRTGEEDGSNSNYIAREQKEQGDPEDPEDPDDPDEEKDGEQDEEAQDPVEIAEKASLLETMIRWYNKGPKQFLQYIFAYYGFSLNPLLIVTMFTSDAITRIAKLIMTTMEGNPKIMKPTAEVTDDFMKMISDFNAENMTEEQIQSVRDMITTSELFHGPAFEFLGPGTNVDKRIILGEKGQAVPTSIPDTIAMKHDMYYMLKDPKARQRADKLFMSEIWPTIRSNQQISTRIGSALTLMIFGIKNAIERQGIIITKALSGDPDYLDTATEEDYEKIDNAAKKYMKIIDSAGYTFSASDRFMRENTAGITPDVKEAYAEFRNDIAFLFEPQLDPNLKNAGEQDDEPYIIETTRFKPVGSYTEFNEKMILEDDEPFVVRFAEGERGDEPYIIETTRFKPVGSYTEFNEKMILEDEQLAFLQNTNGNVNIEFPEISQIE